MAALSTVAILTLATASVVKTAIDYTEQRKAAKRAEQEGHFEAELFGRNAEMAEDQASDALARGEETAGTIRRGARQLRGDQRAAYAAQGIDIDTGSSADVIASDASLSEWDMLTVRTNAAREAQGFTKQAASERMQGEWARAGGRNRAQSIRNQSVATLLSGAGELASIYRSAPKGVGRGGTASQYSGVPRYP